MFLLLAAVCSIIFNKIKLPPLVGYLIAGIIVANTLTISDDSMTVVEILSDMGLILLMFSLGLEINLKKIRKQGVFAMKVSVIGTPIAVLGGIVFGMAIGLDSIQAICLGGLICGSSTAVVLGVMEMNNRATKEEKETITLILIIEDITQVVFLSMVTPLMAGGEMDAGGLAAMIVSIVAFMVVSIFAGLRLMPRIINWISDNVSSEILTVTTVGLAFGMALLANYAGLSVAIGAFLMGMIIASSRKSKDILHDIEPMKNIFMAMFFISVGMEVYLDTFMDNILLTVEILLVFVLVKFLSRFLGYWFANDNAKSSFSNTLGFLVMGEFAFIIAKEALVYNVFDEGLYSAVIGAAILSMILLPFITKNSDENWEKAKSHCPKSLLNFCIHIDEAKSSFYYSISKTSKRTRKEIASSMTLSYFLLLLIAFIEIVFVLISQPLVDWGMNYFPGGREVWSALVLILNIIAIFFPLYRFIGNLRNINTITKQRSEAEELRRSSRFLNGLTNTDTAILTLMIGIGIIIVVPNGIELWEHFLVLGIAFIVLAVYNHFAILRKVAPKTEEDTVNDDIGFDEFMEVLTRKILENDEKAGIHRTASIDTGDKRY